MFDEHFFKKLTVSPEKESRLALLALEIFAVATGNFPAAFAVVAIHTLLALYENSPDFMHAADAMLNEQVTMKSGLH